MADLQTALIARLAAAPPLAGGRVFWGVVPQATPLPYVRLQTISDPRRQHLKDYDAARITRVQADAFAASYGEARALAKALIARLAAPAALAGVRFGRGRAEGPRDLGEETTAGFVHRLSTDFLIEHTEE